MRGSIFNGVNELEFPATGEIASNDPDNLVCFSLENVPIVAVNRLHFGTIILIGAPNFKTNNALPVRGNQ